VVDIIIVKILKVDLEVYKYPITLLNGVFLSNFFC